MNMTRLFNPLVRLIALALIAAPWQQPISASSAVTKRTLAQPLCGSPLELRPVFSDFDGDNKIDRARLTARGQYKNIQVALSNAPHRSLFFDTGVLDYGRLLTGDVDRDNDEDLIWVSQNHPKKIVLWLSDGQGDFSLISEPPPDAQQLTALLSQDSESKLAEGADSLDLSAVLTPSDATELELPKPLAILIAPLLLRERSDQPVIGAPFLSVLSRRGPPRRLA